MLSTSGVDKMSNLFSNRILSVARLHDKLVSRCFSVQNPFQKYIDKKSKRKFRLRILGKKHESKTAMESNTEQSMSTTDRNSPVLEQLKSHLNSLYVDENDSNLDDVKKMPIEMKPVKQRHDKKNKTFDIHESQSVLMFPGQGSQFVGMGETLLDYPNVPEMFEIASSILKYDLLDICLNGPKSELDKTVHCQPAVVVTSLAALQKLSTDNPQVVDSCVATAGFSVGEITALIFAGVLSFEDGIELVKCRAEAMQELCNEEPSGMMTVVQNHETNLKLAMKLARDYCSTRHHIEYPVCAIANYLAPNMKVIAGHEPALGLIEENYKDFGILKVKRLPVSGAFHTKLMKPAENEVRKVLNQCKRSFKKPTVPVLSNSYAFPYQKSSVISLLLEQISRPVKWEHIMKALYVRQETNTVYPQTYEVGPGKQLGLFLRNTNRDAFTGYLSVEV